MSRLFIQFSYFIILAIVSKTYILLLVAFVFGAGLAGMVAFKEQGGELCLVLAIC